MKINKPKFKGIHLQYKDAWDYIHKNNTHEQVIDFISNDNFLCFGVRVFKYDVAFFKDVKQKVYFKYPIISNTEALLLFAKLKLDEKLLFKPKMK